MTKTTRAAVDHEDHLSLGLYPHLHSNQLQPLPRINVADTANPNFVPCIQSGIQTLFIYNFSVEKLEITYYLGWLNFNN